jgi:hypothetical protein
MSITYTDLQNRISTELTLLGDFSAVWTDLIKDALTDLCNSVEPMVHDTISIVPGTLIYSVPATIDDIARVQDSLGNGVVYSLNQYTRLLTLQNDVATTGTLDVWGSPLNPRTNYAAIIAGLDEKFIPCLWAFLKYRCYEQADSDMQENFLAKADKEAHKLLQAINYNPGYYMQVSHFVDNNGNVIDDPGNADGLNVNIAGIGATDTYTNENPS